MTRSVTAPRPATLPGQGGVSGYLGDRLANSFHDGDAGTGILTSPAFTVTQPYLNFLVGGGNHPHVPGTVLNATARPGPCSPTSKAPPTDAGWTATGDFVGTGPVAGAIGDQQPVSGYLGSKLVNTFLNHDPSHRHDHLTDLHHQQRLHRPPGRRRQPPVHRRADHRAPDRPRSTWSSTARSSPLRPGRTTRR